MFSRDKWCDIADEATDSIDLVESVFVWQISYIIDNISLTWPSGHHSSKVLGISLKEASWFRGVQKCVMPSIVYAASCGRSVKSAVGDRGKRSLGRRKLASSLYMPVHASAGDASTWKWKTVDAGLTRMQVLARIEFLGSCIFSGLHQHNHTEYRCGSAGLSHYPVH